MKRLEARRGPFHFDLVHDVVCNATGVCTCERKDVDRRRRLKGGRIEVKPERIRLPKGIHLLPGNPPVEVPDAALRIRRVNRALASGMIATVEG